MASAVTSGVIPTTNGQIIVPGFPNSLAASPAGGLNLAPYNPFFTRNSGMSSSIWAFLLGESSATMTQVQSSSVPGGIMTQFVCTGDTVAALAGAMIPIDTNKSYFMRAWIQQTALSGGASPVIYAGYACYSSTGALLSPAGGSTYNYALAYGLANPTGWHSSAFGTVGTGATNFPTGTAFIQPVMLLGYGLSTGDNVTYLVSTPEVYENVGINSFVVPTIQSTVFSVPNLGSGTTIANAGSGWVFLSTPGDDNSALYSVGSATAQPFSLFTGTGWVNGTDSPSTGNSSLYNTGTHLVIYQNFQTFAVTVGVTLIGNGF